jgi:hypothetical protein
MDAWERREASANFNMSRFAGAMIRPEVRYD